MYLRFHCFVRFVIALMLGFAAAAAHGQTDALPTAATLHGHVTDPSGALIPGAKVIVATPAGKSVASAIADASGALLGGYHPIDLVNDLTQVDGL